MNGVPTGSSFPWVAMNGRLIPARSAFVSIFDRSFQLGDGVFETIRVLDGCPLEWQAHWRRFINASNWAGITVPLQQRRVRSCLKDLLKRNRTADAVLRLHLTRGIGTRGYSPANAKDPILVMTLHPGARFTPGIPHQVHVSISTLRFDARNPTLHHKTASRILNVIVKAEAESADFDDALLLDRDGFVTEAVSSNLFWITQDCLNTTPLETGGLPGTTRAALLKLCRRVGIRTGETRIRPARLLRADGVFLTSSTVGIAEVV